MGSRTDARLDYAEQSALQREIACGENIADRRRDVGRRAEGRVPTRAREQPHDLLLVPHVLGAQLLWLPPLDDRESEAANAAQRRAHDAQLDLIQLSGASRRRLH